MEHVKQELAKLLQISGPYQQAAQFLAIVKRELEICHSYLSREESREFKRYYHRLENVHDRCLSYWQNQYAPKTQYLAQSSKPNSKVLDAGCGIGTESILSALLGAEVTGVDLSEERLRIAEKRVQLYRKLVEPLRVRFSAQSIFNIPDNYDVIWSQQSISHIEPAGGFIKFCYEHLNSGGKLIIADSNALNPIVYFQAKMEQWQRGGETTKKIDPHTGRNVPYAQERLLSVCSIQRLIESRNFHIEKLTTYGFSPYLPFSFQDKDIAYYTNYLDMVPIIRSFAAGYVVIATKE